MDISTPVEEYPHLADIVIHAIDVANAYAEANTLYRLAIDARFPGHRPTLAEQADVLNDRWEACIAEVRRRSVEMGNDRLRIDDYRYQ